MELFHVSSQIISVHKWIPSVASGAPPYPPLSLPELSGHPTLRKVGGQEQGGQVVLRLHLCVKAWETQAAHPNARQGRVHSRWLPLTQTTGKWPPVQKAQGSLLLCLVRGRIVAISISPEI